MKWQLLALPLLPVMLLTGCVSNQDLGLSVHQWNALNARQKNDYKKQYKLIKSANKFEPLVSEGPNIVVDISGGTAMLPPYASAQDYRRIHFNINPGQCLAIPVRALANSTRAKLRACYSDRTLYIDPSRYDNKKQPGTLFFTYTPMWQQGFVYKNMQSKGYIRFDAVNVRIKSLGSYQQKEKTVAQKAVDTATSQSEPNETGSVVSKAKAEGKCPPIRLGDAATTTGKSKCPREVTMPKDSDPAAQSPTVLPVAASSLNGQAASSSIPHPDAAPKSVVTSSQG